MPGRTSTPPASFPPPLRSFEAFGKFAISSSFRSYPVSGSADGAPSPKGPSSPGVVARRSAAPGEARSASSLLARAGYQHRRKERSCCGGQNRGASEENLARLPPCRKMACPSLNRLPPVRPRRRGRGRRRRELDADRIVLPIASQSIIRGRSKQFGFRGLLATEIEGRETAALARRVAGRAPLRNPNMEETSTRGDLDQREEAQKRQSPAISPMPSGETASDGAGCWSGDRDAIGKGRVNRRPFRSISPIFPPFQ